MDLGERGFIEGRWRRDRNLIRWVKWVGVCFVRLFSFLEPVFIGEEGHRSA